MDLVLMGGNVLTMDSRNSRAEAVAVQAGKLAAVGANAEMTHYIGPDTTVVHLAGRTLIPGFLDPHNHFSLTTFDPVSVDCRTPSHQSLTSLLEAIATAAADAPRGRWIRGWGFRAFLVRENRPLTRWELDEVAPDNPVCVMDGSVHACYANSAALTLAGLDRQTPDPAHGQYLREANGELNGTLWERGMNAIHALSLRAYLDYYEDSVADLVQANCMRHLSYGITSVGDALVTPEVAQMYRLTDAQHKLPMVLHQMLGGTQFFSPPQAAAQGTIETGHVSDRLRGNTVKIFMDPAFPRYALIRYHPCNHEEHLGECYYTQDEVDTLVLSAHRRGMQVAIHCLGNGAVEQALTAFERAQRASPRAEPRFRIEHFTLTTPAQLRRAHSLGVIAVVQPPFVHTRGEAYTGTAQDMGGEVRALAFQSMLAAGVTVAASSDSPCAPVEPLLGLYAMVTRRHRTDGALIGPEEAVTPLDGLQMYTSNAAYAMGRDHEVGTLEPGKRADMVVLSHDPTTVDPDFIRHIAIDGTYVEGHLVPQR
jgi:predicted amidohydrolase YtcJ